MIDEELLKPSREHLALLRAQIQQQHELAASDIERYGYGSREYAQQRWDEFHMATGPMYREIEAVVKTMVDYYAAQPIPPQFIDVGESRTRDAGQPPS
jgi:hypothetical protein